jgi:hypothetical protein
MLPLSLAHRSAKMKDAAPVGKEAGFAFARTTVSPSLCQKNARRRDFRYAANSATLCSCASSSQVSNRTGKPHNRRRCVTTAPAASLSGRPRRWT